MVRSHLWGGTGERSTWDQPVEGGPRLLASLGWGSPHPPVVPDALEEVQCLLQAVGLVVLPDDHVVAAAGHHEDDGSHIWGAERAGAGLGIAVMGIQQEVHPQKPWHLPLKHWIHLRRSSRWPPTSNMLGGGESTGSGSEAGPPTPAPALSLGFYLLEVHFVHLELGLKDSRGQDAAAKQVLQEK